MDKNIKIIMNEDINEVKDHLKKAILSTLDPYDLEYLVKTFIELNNSTFINLSSKFDGDKEYDSELNYQYGFEDGKKSCLTYIYNELEKHRKTEKDFAFINDDCKAREDNKLIINCLEYLIKKLGV